MRIKTLLSLSAVALGATLATPGFANDANGLSVNGSATLVSDYRFRGISQTNKRFAIQGGLTVSHTSGFYVSTWGSSIDDYVASGSDQEIDFIAGWSKTWADSTKLDVGVLYYYYPGSGGATTDFVEPYASISHTFGPVTGKLSAAYAPKSAALSVGNGKEDNLYLAADLSASIPNTGVGLTAHLGHTEGPSFLVPVGDNYTDWSLGVTYTTGPVTLGVSYVDTDTTFVPFTRDVAKAGVVASVGVSF